MRLDQARDLLRPALRMTAASANLNCDMKVDLEEDRLVVMLGSQEGEIKGSEVRDGSFKAKFHPLLVEMKKAQGAS